MLKLKGVYNWKLVDDLSGKIVQEGTKENTITDSLLYALVNGSGLQTTNARIILSITSVPLPTNEYRLYGVAESAIARTVESSSLVVSTYDIPTRKVTWANNFAAPVSTRTITIFGLDLSGGVWRNFASFVILDTPITQTSTQSLYVSYSIYLDFVSVGGLNCASNVYVDQEVKRRIIMQQGGLGIFISPSGTSESWKLAPFYTAWDLNSLDLTKVMSPPNWFAAAERGVYSLGLIDTATGTYFGQNLKLSINTTNYAGPIGAVCYGRLNFGGIIWQSLCHSVSPSSLSPSISRVFAHPASRNREVIFSDVSYPPSSRGLVTLSGTPTNKWPFMTGRIRITKTGDASDIVGGNLSGTSGNDYITVDETGWVVDDRITLSGGSLPAPLTATTYWVVHVSGADIKVSSSQGGSAITLSGNGTGTYERYNTGKFRLEYNSMMSVHAGELGYGYYASTNGRVFWHNQLVVDYEGNVYPGSLKYDGNSNGSWSQRAIWREGDFCYSIHETSLTSTTYQFAKQRYASVESPEALFSFPKTTAYIYSVSRGVGAYEDIVYLATSDGVYKWDLSSPSTPISKIAITGMINDTVYDVSFDPERGYLWTGHMTGLSKVDLSANTATTYTIAGGELSGGLTADEVKCWPGSLQAYDGRVIISFGGVASTGTWVLDDDYDGSDSIGWYRINNDRNTENGAAPRYKDRKQLVWRNRFTWYLYSLTVTGKGTGTLTTLSSLAASDQNYGYSARSPLIRLNDRQYYMIPNGSETATVVNISGDTVDETYDVRVLYGSWFSASGIAKSTIATSGLNTLSLLYSGHAKSWIDIDNGIKVHFASIAPVTRVGAGSIIAVEPYAHDLFEFGWDGSNWIIDEMQERPIKKTGTIALLSGVSVQFNNDSGQPWDTQFIEGERFTWMQAPVPIKDNLQTYDIRSRVYSCGVERVVEWSTTAASSVLIPECRTGTSPDPDFRDLDTTALVTTVYDVTGSVELTNSTNTSPPSGSYYMSSTGEFKFHADQIGHTVKLTYNYTVF